jgi:hypothetical protein
VIDNEYKSGLLYYVVRLLLLYIGKTMGLFDSIMWRHSPDEVSSLNSFG